MRRVGGNVMKIFRNQSQKQRRGTATVEMALVLPIFIMVTFGIIEFGRAMMVSQLVVNSAREGARRAVLEGSTNANIETTVKDFLVATTNISAADVSVTVTIVPDPLNTDPLNVLGSSNSGDIITVAVAVPFDKVQFVTGNYLNGKMLRGQATMRHE